MAINSSSRRRYVKSASSLGCGTLSESEQVDYKPTRQPSTLSTSDDSSVASSSITSFQYTYDSTTGLPVFDIDYCSDDELLGGEAGLASRTEELEAIKEIRSALTKDEKSQLTDPRMLIRHWRAEKGNTKRALQTLRDALQWRRDFEVTPLRVCMQNNSDKLLGHKDYQEMMRLENTTGKIYVRGTTLEGRALMYMFAMRNNTDSDADNMRHLVWNLEKAIRVTQHHSQGQLDKYCLLVDCTDYDLRKSPSLQASKMTLDVLQKHFKERMYRIYVLNPPLAFRIFWKLVQPFIDPVTKTKLVFCTGPNSDGAKLLHKEVGLAAAKKLETCAHGTGDARPFCSKEYLELPMHLGFDE